MKNYGFVKNEIADPKAYRVLGAKELPKVTLVEGGQWSGWTPIDELQHTPTFDSYGCVVYGTENIQQTLERFHFGETKEYDERYNYNILKIIPPGADPHDAAESFRNDGVVSGLLPMTATYEEYAKPRPVPNDIISKGIAHPHMLLHQWLWETPVNKTIRTSLIKEYLKYSPLGVSVTAWREQDGVYVDDGKRNTHWTMLYGYNDKGWLIYDSYAPHRKILSYDHNIECCKRYQLVPSTRQAQISILSRIIALISQWIGLLPKPEAITPVEAPQPQPEPSNRDKLYLVAKKYLGIDNTPQDLVPDEVACAEHMCTIMRHVDPTFPIIPFTGNLLKELQQNPKYRATTEIKEGNIIINATGTGNNTVRGHCGILIDGGRIASNNSVTGKWDDHWILGDWNLHYRVKGGMTTHVFEAVDK